MVLQFRRLPKFAGQVGLPRRELSGADAEGDSRAALPGGPLEEGDLDGALRVPEEQRAVAGGPELVLTHPAQAEDAPVPALGRRPVRDVDMDVVNAADRRWGG